MNRRFIFWLSLLVVLLAACQPIRPETAATTTPSATGAITDTLTSTTETTATAALTGSSDITTSDESTGSTSASSLAVGEERAATTCPAISDDAFALTVQADWEAGDQRIYQVHQGRTEILDGESTTVMSTTAPVTVTVLSADAAGYVLEWDYGQAATAAVDAETPDPISTLLEAPIQVRMTYATDEAGAYVELVNLEELQAQLVPIFDQLFEAIVETEEAVDPTALDAARGMVDQLISNPDNFEILFTQELQLFHTLHGFPFASAEPIVQPDLRPNMLGGAPIPSELTITPTRYDAELGCFQVDFENVADPVATRNSILEALQLQAEQMGVAGPSAEDLPDELELVDFIHFEINVDSGWPALIASERTTTFGNQGRVDTTQIVLTSSNE